MNHKWTYFVSSTFEDLRPERIAVVNQILAMNEIPLGMEQFGAADSTSWNNIVKYIDTADYYILIIAGRYGSLDKKLPDLSFTHREYRYARESGIPVFPLIHSNVGKLPSEFVEQDAEKKKKLAAFREEVRENHNVSWFSNLAELIGGVSAAVSAARTQYPRPGWVRHSEDSESSRATIAQLRKELEERTDEVRRLRDIASRFESDSNNEISGGGYFNARQKLREIANVRVYVELLGEPFEQEAQSSWMGLFIDLAISMEESTFPESSLGDLLNARLQSLADKPHIPKDATLFLHSEFIKSAQYVFESLELIARSNYRFWHLTKLGRKIYVDWRAEQIIPSRKREVWER